MSTATKITLAAAVLGLAALYEADPPAGPLPRHVETPGEAQARALASAREAADERAGKAMRALRRATRNPGSFELLGARGNADASRLCIVYRGQNGFGGMSAEAAYFSGNRWRAGHGVTCKGKSLPVDYTGSGLAGMRL